MMAVKFVFIILWVAIAVGCTSKINLALIPAPVLYKQNTINPFVHLNNEKRTTSNTIHFATLREPEITNGDLTYNNKVSNQLHLGSAQVQFGDASMNWEGLVQASLSSTRTELVPLSLTKITEIAHLPQHRQSSQRLTPEQQKFIDEINSELHHALDKEIMLYVHGTKAAFKNAAIVAAELDHFAGRDFVSICFSWPSHQNIFSYLVGTDVKRAKYASQSLAIFIEFLATHTKAERINVLSFSAGARTTSKAIYEMVQDTPIQDLRSNYKLGSVIYAAADVPIDVFLERLPASSLAAEKVVITVTDDDNALRAAKRFMRGLDRAGSTDAEETEKDFIIQSKLTNVEIVDVSLGKELRGFDITGHRYWYRHPWISSDMIFLLRTDLPAARRGLSSADVKGVWYLAPDYPERIVIAANRELQQQWTQKTDD